MNHNMKFIESICYNHGDYQLINLHQNRINETFMQFFPQSTPIQLQKILPGIEETSKHKIRIVYSDDGFSLTVERYTLKSINSMQIIDGTYLDYSFKYENRNALTSLFEEKTMKDDIIIIQNDQVTDSYYANLIFYDGTKWYTPDTFLLNGIKRQHLLNTNQIIERPISKADLSQFESVSLINAMLDPGEIQLPITSISS